MNEQLLREHETCCPSHRFKCMSWTGIIVGALVAVGLSFLSSLFGAGIGLSAFNTSPEGVKVLAIGGYVGMLIVVIAVMFFSGLVAGYLGRSNSCNRTIGALHGFAAWCLALVFMIILLSHTTLFISTNSLHSMPHQTTTVKALNDNSSRMVTEAAHVKVTNSRVVDANVNNEETARILALSSLLTFVLFFVGAVFSAIGGHCGSKRDFENCNSHKN